MLVKPETLLGWHRDVFRLFWRWRSRRKAPAKPRISADVVLLIRRMAIENRLWGAERIRGELLKLGHSVAKSTIQRYISRIRRTPPEGQRWSTFLRNQAAGIWSCDLFEVRDLWFRCHFVFVVMQLESRRLLLAAATTAPSAEWLAQHLQRVLDQYRAYYNTCRPHQGIGQRRPDTFDRPARAPDLVVRHDVVSRPVLRGLHHDYRSAA